MYTKCKILVLRFVAYNLSPGPVKWCVLILVIPRRGGYIRYMHRDQPEAIHVDVSLLRKMYPDHSVCT